MASAVLPDPSKVHQDRGSRLSLSLDAPASASPFPSPSSSFLPPPMPGAHEFAVKPPPPGRTGRKGSTPIAYTTKRDDDTNGTATVLDTGNHTPRSQRSSVDHDKSAPITGTSGVMKDSRRSSPLYDSTVFTPTTPSQDMVQATPTLSSTPTPFAESFIYSNGATANGLSPGKKPDTTTTAATSDTTHPTEDPQNSIAIQEPHSPSYIITPASHHRTYSQSKTIPFLTSDSMPANAPTPNRPAPPSPALSRRISGAPSTSSSTRSKSSRPPSTAVSRANSLRRNKPSSASTSPKAARRLSLNPGVFSGPGTGFTPVASPLSESFPTTTPFSASTTRVSSSASPTTPRHTYRVQIRIRDYGFNEDDVRFVGRGPLVPKENRVGRLNRRLGVERVSGVSIESFTSSEDGEGGGGDRDRDGGGGWEGEDVGEWDGFRMGMGKIWQSWNPGFDENMVTRADDDEGREGFPSRRDLDINFREIQDDDDDDEEYHDAEEDDNVMIEGDEEEPLYPGLYRALYAFEPEGTAEMRLEEDQLVRVVGRGGGVGWAVVLDERLQDEDGAASNTANKHALVPESYLEPVKLDWEAEVEGTTDDGDM